MSGDARSLHDLWAALSRVTRRLDELAASVSRLDPTDPAPPPGEPLDESTRTRLRTLESLLAVGPHLGRQVAVVLALDRVIHQAGAECAALFVPTPEGDLDPETRRGFPSPPLRLRPEEGIVGRAYREGDAIRAGPAHQAADPLLRDHGIAHALAVPVALPGAAVSAVLFAGRWRPAAFADEAIQTLALLAERLALTLGRPLQPSERAADLLELGIDLDLERTGARAVRLLAVRLGATRAALFVPDESGVRLIAAVSGPSEPVVLDPSPPPIAAALRSGRPWIATPFERDPAVDRLVPGDAQAVIPLGVGDQVVGVLVAGGPQPLPLAAVDEVLLPAAVAIRNARLFDETVIGLRERREADRQTPPPPPPVRDFANLLAVILARVGLARERIEDRGLGAELRVAEEAAWRAAEAVRGLLGFAPGRRDAPLVPLDLGVVIRDAVEDARREWATRPGSPPAVTLDLVPLPPIRGSADDLREALHHLLENAAEAVPPGGPITVRARWDGKGRIEILIEDAGTGMDESVRARALEPFFTTKGRARLGLGLPVTQAIVAHHHGTLDLVSVPEAGTTVRLGFPTAGATARVFETPIRQSAVARILVVEDDAAVRDALVQLLSQEGHVVLGAAEGGQALALAQRERLDVVFTDLDLAGLSGLELARQIKRLWPKVRVILLTAWPGRLDDAVVGQSGIDRVIEKPVGVEEVLAALDAELARRPSFQS